MDPSETPPANTPPVTEPGAGNPTPTVTESAPPQATVSEVVTPEVPTAPTELASPQPLTDQTVTPSTDAATAPAPESQMVDNPRVPAPDDPTAQPQPAPINPAPLAPPAKKGAKKLIIILAIAILGLSGLIIGLIFLLGLNSTPVYTNLKSATVGDKAGQKIVFSYPEDMEEVTNKNDAATYADYESDSKKTVYAEVNVDSAEVGVLSTEDIAGFKDILKNKKEGYQETIDSLKKETFKDESNITYSDFKDFKSAKIKDGIQTDITFKNEATGKQGKGRIIFTFGKERLYGMILLGEQSVWDKNTSTWDKVIDSWAIDQP